MRRWIWVLVMAVMSAELGGFAQPGKHGSVVVPEEARVDVNRATLTQLIAVPGLTGTWAARIIRFRPYRTKLDLMEHGVLPAGVYDRAKEYLIAHGNRR